MAAEKLAASKVQNPEKPETKKTKDNEWKYRWLYRIIYTQFERNFRHFY